MDLIDSESTQRNQRRRARAGTALAIALGLLLGACTESSGGDTTTTAAGEETTTAAGEETTTTGAAQSGTQDYTMVTFFENCSFCQTLEAGAIQAGEEFGVNVQIVQPGGVDAETLNPALQAATAAEPDAIGISYFTKGQETAILDTLDLGIPIVLFNNNRFEAVDGDPATATTDPRILTLPYVGQDETKSGEVLMTYLMPLLGEGKVVIVNNSPGATVLTMRADGVKRVLDANNVPYEDLDAEMDEVVNEQILSAYLEANPDVAGIIGLGNPSSNPAAKLVGELGLDIIVGTFDVDTAAVEHIKAGTLTAALNQQPWLQGYYSVQNMYVKTVLGLQPVNVDTGTQIVTIDNVADLEAAVAAGRN
ncbi:MAG: substrate-binding domain-containing protein [Acidimicrobiia bacterium]